MSGELKIDREYIILAGSDVVKVKVLDVTATSIRVHNLDDDFIKRYLLEDYKPRVIEEVSKATHEKERAEILDAVNTPTVDFGTLTSPSNHENFVEAFTKHLEGNEDKILKTSTLGQSNAERLAAILKANSQEEVEELTKEGREIWKEITSLGHPYKVSNKGRVKNNHNKVLKPTVRGTQQYYLLVGMDKTQKCLNINTLLEEVFGLKKV